MHATSTVELQPDTRTYQQLYVTAKEKKVLQTRTPLAEASLLINRVWLEITST